MHEGHPRKSQHSSNIGQSRQSDTGRGPQEEDEGTRSHVVLSFNHMKENRSKPCFCFCLHGLKIQEEMKHFGINIYQFPECDSDEDEDFKTHDQILKVLRLNPHVINELLDPPRD